ncbi:MAG TPA: hypothetical protein VGN01_05050 [Acidobacteriaceae bacterium]|jgi:hypothetical protein
MRGNRALHVLKVLAIVAVAFTVFGFVTMQLWNWLMPALFGLKTITFLQAVGVVVLSKILLGGFRAPWARKRQWKQDLAERWTEMNPEERERFLAGMRGRWGCGFGPERGAPGEQKPVV